MDSIDQNSNESLFCAPDSSRDRDIHSIRSTHNGKVFGFYGYTAYNRDRDRDTEIYSLEMHCSYFILTFALFLACHAHIHCVHLSVQPILQDQHNNHKSLKSAGQASLDR